jgi:hypothetical protein
MQIFSYRYCAKLPSDTFTRLTPEWSIETVNINDRVMYTCSLRLPINSPLKYVITVSVYILYITKLLPIKTIQYPTISYILII